MSTIHTTEPLTQYVEVVPDPESVGRELAKITVEVSPDGVSVTSTLPDAITELTVLQARRFCDAYSRAYEASLYYYNDLDIASVPPS